MITENKKERDDTIRSQQEHHAVLSRFLPRDAVSLLLALSGFHAAAVTGW
jgi:hypothetical protein